MKKAIWLLVFTVLVIAACRRRETRWDNNLLLPLFNTNLTLNDVDRRFLVNNLADTGYTLIYDNLVYSGSNIDVQAPDTSINTSFTLRRLKLSDRSITQRIALRQINPLFGFLDGQTVDLPAQDQSNLSPVDIDASAFFETATLDSGFLDITLKNELPANVRLVVFEIQNADDQSVVAIDSFTNIPSNSSATRTVNLRNKTVRKTLKGIIRRLITDASAGPVLIDANKGVEVQLSVRNLRPRSAVAAFPNQTVLDQDAGLTLDMGGPQVKFFKVRTGSLRLKVESTIQENMTMLLKIPSASKDGQELERIVKLPGAKSGGREVREEVVDMAGYVIDFRGKDPDVKDTVNTFHQILLVTLDSSGRKVQVTLNDSIRILYRLEKLVPEYATGYLGKTLNQGKGRAPFTLFRGADGNITLKDFKASVLIRNSVGAEGRIRVNNLTGGNVFTKNQVQLAAAPLAFDIFVTAPPFIRNRYTETEILMNSGNSNIKPFVENLPQWIDYDIDIETNPNGNVSNWKDFVFDNSRVDIFLRLEAPATFSVGGLNLRDTQAINANTLPNLEKVKSATLILDMENGYPFALDLNMVMLDAGYLPLGDVEVKPATVAAGTTLPNGQPLQASRSVLKIQIPREKADLLRRTKFVAITAKIKGSGGQQKIYSTYTLKIKTSLQAEYETGI